MADRTGGELIQDFLGAYEIPFVFGNPGTTETTFFAAIAASKATYVLASCGLAGSALQSQASDRQIGRLLNNCVPICDASQIYIASWG